LPKIIEGRLQGFLKDVVLMEQTSVQASKKSVQAILDEAGVTVTAFARLEVGGA
jgi:elongation factor Ts